MSIDSVKMNQPSFAGKTKEGNDYDKTSAGKIAGTLLGVHATANKLSRIKRIPMSEVNKAGKKVIKDTFSKNGKMVGLKNSEKAAILKNLQKINKASKITAGIAVTIVTMGAWIGIGAIVDKVVNSHRKAKADKAAD